MLLNIVGVKEAAGLNIFLALADLGTQALLVVIGLFVVFSPEVLQANVDLGVTPTWRDFIVAVPVAMVAYTGIETISNMAEEAIDPPRHVPRSIMYVVLAVFAIYAFLPSVALSALPVVRRRRRWCRTSTTYQCTSSQDLQVGDKTSELACRFSGDPVAGLVENLGLPPTITDGLGYYVAILAATILIIATNAGIIGVSRLTYSMGQHRQLPEAIRRVHPRFNTPYVAICLYSFAAVAADDPDRSDHVPGQPVRVRRHALVHAGPRGGDPDAADHARPGDALARADVVPVGDFDVPTFAIIGGLGTLASRSSSRSRSTGRRAIVGVGWLAVGMVVYVVYRHTQGLPLTETVLAPQSAIGPAVEVEYRSILMPISSDRVDDEMTATALKLAAESGTSLVVMYPIEVPLAKPLSAPMEVQTAEAEVQLREAAALGRQYGVDVITRIVRTRSIGQAIVDEAERRRSEIIVLGARNRAKPGQRLLGPTVDYVLRNATCRVMVGALPAGG